MSGSVKRSTVVGVLAIAAMLGLVACGNNNNSSSGTTTTTKGASKTVVVIKPADFDSSFSAMAKLKPVTAAGKGKVAVLLPDTTTSARYETFDRPYLMQALQAAGLSASDIIINNAQGSAQTMQTQAEAAITDGATVLLVDALDSGSGAAIESAAAAKGVKSIDYDRLVKGGVDGRYYVSFDNVKVGQLIGQGFVDCTTAWKVSKPNVLVMDGDPTDNNAKLFAQGYNGVLQPKFDGGTFVKVGEPAGTWTPSVAATTFTQQLTAHPNINSAVTPNDDNANAVIAQIQAKGIKPNTFPTTGQDASLSGLQNILKGYQCGTVYKPIYLEAQGAAAVALYLRAGMNVPSELLNGSTADGSKNVPSVLLTPTWVTKDNMAATVVKDKAVNGTQLCVSAVAAACAAAGINP
jgi:D-xylose transport system substrate-binding protein